MIVLDTNVVSALMRLEDARRLQPWLDTVSPLDLYTTAITRAEIRYGIARLAAGAKRRELQHAADMFFTEIADRTLPFDSRAADFYGDLVAARQAAGRPISVPDAVIASIAGVQRAAVATRDAGGFAGCGVPVIDPFVPGA